MLTSAQTLPVCEPLFLGSPCAAAVVLTGAQTPPASCESQFLGLPCAAAVMLTSAQTSPGCESQFLGSPCAAAVMLTRSFLDIIPLLYIEHSVCDSQNTTVTTCISTLTHHSIFEHFHSTSGVKVAVAICMCAQQIFFDGSARKKTFTPAFGRAVGIYRNKVPASGLLDDMECWVERWAEQSNSTNVAFGDDPDFFQKASLTKNNCRHVNEHDPRGCRYDK
ncbi:hypothetical protein DFH07DRAFT_765637 [Mycena maculata]|uniref:Uncharacterized protein n=1 Tax=Mycena maculata TaxID=230809 RepID=A0AAD7KAZ7_9AGAR|nr:hypothetical protein DFH07DRAFT_765637 [Mycena maculata]